MKNQPSILLVEDEFIIADQIQTFLKSNGYQVCGIVDNYSDAINALKIYDPDLVIADIRLGDDYDGGIKVGQYICKYLNTPIVYLSGYSDSQTLEKAKTTRPNTFLLKPKPLDKQQLITTIHMALPFKNACNDGLKIKARKFSSADEAHNKVRNLSLMPYSIRLSDVYLIESFNHVIKNTIVLRQMDGNNFLVRTELEQLAETLPEYFLRIHKSYIVSKRHISGFKYPDCIHLSNH